MTMPYTLWSRNRLIGETDLGFIYRENRYRVGWFHPNEFGERLMPTATGVGPAMRAEAILGPDGTLSADLLAAIDQCESLELELRGPDGERFETEDIGIIDTHYLLSLADAADADRLEEEPLSPEDEKEIEEFVAEWKAAHPQDEEVDEPEVEFPRYQIQVRFAQDTFLP
jgi:hypothetical protein